MNWKQAVALGLCSVGEYKGEPVAYLFNGVRLPKLPEWDREKYPYAFIQYDDVDAGNALLHFRSFYVLSNVEYLVSDKSGHWCISLANKYMKSNGVKDDEGNILTWEDFGAPQTSGGYAVHNNGLLWANFDVLNEDGTVYLKATDPIPVYE